ncbi:hypothetical protein AS202_19855 (plasmid) [Myroides odoratimimus]|uniref:Uncharacterized protein n=2 Tax=Flavobacteriaceae TaxID=49546 RepID=A0AAI8G732_9FLAO|nr:hypothetical protein AS202_19855 [Myroides odoratimimus]
MSCSSDDNTDRNPVDIIDKDNTILKGNWEFVEYLYMDSANNIIQEVPASNNGGCGKDKLEIKDEFFIYNFPVLIEEECKEESLAFQYEIKGKEIINLTHPKVGTHVEEVVVVNEAWLSIRESGDDVDYRVFKGELPPNTKYIRYEYKKIIN